jgi:hypothetical protein
MIISAPWARLKAFLSEAVIPLLPLEEPNAGVMVAYLRVNIRVLPGVPTMVATGFP